MHSTNIKVLKEAFDSWRLFTRLNEGDEGNPVNIEGEPVPAGMPREPRRRRLYSSDMRRAWQEMKKFIENVDTVEVLIDPTGTTPFLVFGDVSSGQIWVVDKVDGNIRLPRPGDNIENVVNPSDIREWADKNLPEHIKNGRLMQRWLDNIDKAEQIGNDVIASAKEMRDIEGITWFEQNMPTFNSIIKAPATAFKATSRGLQAIADSLLTYSGKEARYMQNLFKRAFGWNAKMESIEGETPEEMIRLDAMEEYELLKQQGFPEGEHAAQKSDLTQTDLDYMVAEIQDEIKASNKRILQVLKAMRRLRKKEAVGGIVRHGIEKTLQGVGIGGRSMEDVGEDYDILNPPKEDDPFRIEFSDNVSDAIGDMNSFCTDWDGDGECDGGLDRAGQLAAQRGVTSAAKVFLRQTGGPNVSKLISVWPKNMAELGTRLKDERYFKGFLQNLLTEIQSFKVRPGDLARLGWQGSPGGARSWARFIERMIKFAASPTFKPQGGNAWANIGVIVLKLAAWGAITWGVVTSYERIIKFFAGLPDHIAEALAWSLAMMANMGDIGTGMTVDMIVYYFELMAIEAYQKNEQGEELSMTERLLLASLEKSEYSYVCKDDGNPNTPEICRFLPDSATQKPAEVGLGLPTGKDPDEIEFPWRGEGSALKVMPEGQRSKKLSIIIESKRKPSKRNPSKRKPIKKLKICIT